MPAKVTLFRLLLIFPICSAALLLVVACGNADSCPVPNPLRNERDASPEIYNGDVERAMSIRHKYDDLFWRQPNVHAVGIGIIKVDDGQFTDRAGFIIRVTEKIDQSKLPLEDRIPECLEGVLVQILEEAKHIQW